MRPTRSGIDCLRPVRPGLNGARVNPERRKSLHLPVRGPEKTKLEAPSHDASIAELRSERRPRLPQYFALERLISSSVVVPPSMTDSEDRNPEIGPLGPEGLFHTKIALEVCGTIS